VGSSAAFRGSLSSPVLSPVPGFANSRESAIQVIAAVAGMLGFILIGRSVAARNQSRHITPSLRL
jgi:hypothetical protein